MLMQPLPLEKCIVSVFRSKLMCLLLSSVQVKMEEYEKELLELNDNTDRLLRTYAELTEMQMVLEKAAGFFDKKTKLGDMPMESSYDRSFGIDTDGPLLEGGVSSSSSSTERIESVAAAVGATGIQHSSACLTVLWPLLPGVWSFAGCGEGCQGWLHCRDHCPGEGQQL